MSRFPYTPPQELLDLIAGAKRFWLATHVYPDNDGFGSMLAMGRALERAGKDVVMIYNGDGPRSFQFLPGLKRTVPTSQAGAQPDVLMIFDCHELVRVGEVAEQIEDGVKVVVIDHHLGDDTRMGGDIRWLVPESAATACLVQSLIAHLPGVGLDAEMATCLYAAIITDTAGFRLSNTTSDTLRAAAELAQAGADPAATAEKVLHRRRPESLVLMARVIGSAEYHCEGRIVFLAALQEMLHETGGLMTETEGIVNFFTAADGVQLVALFKEERPGIWRISMRATEAFDVQWVASQFGGGGHRQAAGFDIEAPLDELKALMLELFQRELERRVTAS